MVFYRVSAYFIAKLGCDILPMRAVPVLFYSIIVYFMVGKSATMIMSVLVLTKYYCEMRM